MAHERGQADKECGEALRAVGCAAYKKRDAVRCPRCGALVIPSGAPGTWDFPNVSVPGDVPRFIDIEVKAGGKSIPFSDVRAEQRAWALATAEREKWLWFGIGTALNGVSLRRKTWFFPYAVFLELETALGRKSLPYACPVLDEYELQWNGKVWEIPVTHKFWEVGRATTNDGNGKGR